MMPVICNIADVSIQDVLPESGNNAVARVCPAKDGSILSFEYRWWPLKHLGGVIDGSHKGPCSVYMKKVDSALTDPGKIAKVQDLLVFINH
jgi:hypothetical protein